jgi:hypothetical protein
MGWVGSTRDPIGQVWVKFFVPEFKRVRSGRVKKNNKIIMTRPESDPTEPIDTPKYN